MPERPDPLAPPEGYGVKPGQEPETRHDGTCSMSVLTLNGERICGEPAVIRAVNGCTEAEHVGEHDYCPRCWDVVRIASKHCDPCTNRTGRRVAVRIWRATEIATGKPVDLGDKRVEAAVQWAFGGPDTGPGVDWTKVSPAGGDRFA